MYLTGTADRLNSLQGGAPKLGRLPRPVIKGDLPKPESKPEKRGCADDPLDTSPALHGCTHG